MKFPECCYKYSPCWETRAIARARTTTLSTSVKSLSTVQSHMPFRNVVVATATLETVTFCLCNSALYCFILNETFEMLQQQENLYLGYTNLGSHVKFQIIKSNRSFRLGSTCELMLLQQFLTGKYCISNKTLNTSNRHP